MSTLPPQTQKKYTPQGGKSKIALILAASAFLITFIGTHSVAAGLAGFIIMIGLLCVSATSALLALISFVAAIRATIKKEAAGLFWISTILAVSATVVGPNGPRGSGAYVHFKSTTPYTTKELREKSDQLKQSLLATGFFTEAPKPILGGGWMLYGKSDAEYEHEAIVCQDVNGEEWVTINCGYYDIYKSRTYKLKEMIKSGIASILGKDEMKNISYSVEEEPWLNLRPY